MKVRRLLLSPGGRSRLATAALLSLTALASTSGAERREVPLSLASDSSDLSTRRRVEEAKLKVLLEKLESVRKELSAMEDEQSTLLGELQRLDLQIRMGRDELELLRARLDQGYREIDRHLERVQALEASMKELRPLLERRAVALYKLGQLSYLRLLLSVEEPRELTRAYRYVTRLAHSDAETMKRFRAEQEELDQRKAELLARTKEMLETKREVEKTTQALEGRRALKSSMLEEVGRRREMAETLLYELEASREELSKLLGRIAAGEAPGPEELGDTRLPIRMYLGELEWPVEGKVTSRFGRQRHPRFQTVTVQNGIEIDARPGSPVQAVYDGRVVFASWFKGYGKLLILSHPRRVYTLYGYLEDAQVAEGDEVARGQVIALAGDTGPLSKPGLYFEVRDEGQPVDPELWLRRQQ